MRSAAQMMEPGQPVYAQIVARIRSEVVAPDGRLNRARLAELAFQGGRLNDLNAIVHPAVIAAQQRWMNEVFAHDPAAVAVVESALIFEVVRDARARGENESVLADWRRRIDRIVARHRARRAQNRPLCRTHQPAGAAREAAEADARQRLAHQIPDAEKAAMADYVIDNAGDKETLRTQVAALWQRLKAESNNSPAELVFRIVEAGSRAFPLEPRRCSSRIC